MKNYFSIPFLSMVGLISGCGTVAKFYEGPERPIAEVAVIKSWDSYSPGGDRISYDWYASVRAVNGVSVYDMLPPGKKSLAQIRVLPGRYRFKISCETNSHRARTKNIKSQTLEIEATVQAGAFYYPWCSLQASVISGSGQPGAIPGTIIGSPLAGAAFPYLSTKRVP